MAILPPFIRPDNPPGQGDRILFSTERTENTEGKPWKWFVALRVGAVPGGVGSTGAGLSDDLFSGWARQPVLCYRCNVGISGLIKTIAADLEDRRRPPELVPGDRLNGRVVRHESDGRCAAEARRIDVKA